MRVLFCDTTKNEAEFINDWLLTHKDIKVDILEESIDSVKDYDYDVISVFIGSKIDAPKLDKFNSLKLILTRSTGFDHIDMKECARRKIKVANVPDYGDYTVAEFTLGLIIILERKIKKILIKVQNNEVIEPMEIRGNDIRNKIVGIVGAGKIGTNIGLLANAFGAKIVYFNRSNQPKLDVINAKKMELDELLKVSDIISINLPLTSETNHLINTDRINILKKGAIIINTSRGAIIDTDALVFGLQNNIIGGVALDVIEGEELQGREIDIIRQKAGYEQIKEALESNILKKFDNVILTPHIAYDTQEAVNRIIEETLENLDNFITGRELKNLVS